MRWKKATKRVIVVESHDASADRMSVNTDKQKMSWLSDTSYIWVKGHKVVWYAIKEIFICACSIRRWEGERNITSSASLSISPREMLMSHTRWKGPPPEEPRLPGGHRSCSGATLATLTYWWSCSHKIIRHFSRRAEFILFPHKSWRKSPRNEQAG